MLGLLAVLGIAALIWMAFAAAPQPRPCSPACPTSDKAAVVEALTTRRHHQHASTATPARSPSPKTIITAPACCSPRRACPAARQSGDDDARPTCRWAPAARSRASGSARAREADLARTIEAIDAVADGARPSRRRAAERVRPRRAQCRRLGDADARRRPHARRRPGPGDRQSRRLLGARPVAGTASRWSTRTAGCSPAPAATAPPARPSGSSTSRPQVEDRYRQAIASLLTPIVGAGNFTAEVHAEMDFAEVQATREGFPAGPARADAPSRARSRPRAAPTARRAAGGIPGALSNTPPPAAQVAAAPGGAVTPAAPGRAAPAPRRRPPRRRQPHARITTAPSPSAARSR